MLPNKNQILELSRNQNWNHYICKTRESETHAIKIGRGVRMIKFGIPQNPIQKQHHYWTRYQNNLEL